jgi:hypothetical protein
VSLKRSPTCSTCRAMQHTTLNVMQIASCNDLQSRTSGNQRRQLPAHIHLHSCNINASRAEGKTYHTAVPWDLCCAGACQVLEPPFSPTHLPSHCCIYGMDTALAAALLTS